MEPAILFLMAMLFGAIGTHAATAQEMKTSLSTVELVSEQSTVPSQGGEITLGFRLTPDEGWHAYWTNPGDAGLAVEIEWDLPSGFSAAPLEFPTPHVIPFGPLITYGYNEGILVLSRIKIPSDLAQGQRVRIGGTANWIVCDDQTCVPESATVSTVLEVGDGKKNPATTDRFEAARELLPDAVDWPATLSVMDNKVRLSINLPDGITDPQSPYLFVGEKRLVKYEDQLVSYRPGEIFFDFEAARGADDIDQTGFVLSFEDADGNRQAIAGHTGTPGRASGGPADSVAVDTSGLLTALLFAFFGGIILNLMPCVLPVLSIKALSLVKLSHGDRSLARESGWLYTAGILISFALIGIGLVALRYAGQAAGWGFQMQYPLVNLSLALLMVGVALNLLGAFEIGGSLIGAGQTLTKGGERKSAFFTGFLAVVVATPCTAPFMAGALGFAMTQPAAVSLAIFLSLGFGLALPYLLLSHYPGLSRFMPKPGPWMESFKRILAFPMLLTAIWLLWVLGKQSGVNALALGLVAATLLAFGLWCWGRSAYSARKAWWWIVSLLALGGVIYTSYLVYTHAQAGSTASTRQGGESRTLGSMDLEHFSSTKVADYVEAGQPIFVYFTADWCVSCKVNERVALASDEVGKSFEKRGIKVIEGDWTNQNPEITEWLQRFGRIGVPLYLYFPEGSSLNEPVILPQLLTPKLVIELTS
ncbi:thioredoxin family protein [Pacificimonas sp. WHA3]|uniref:Thioredoxin family protein n=1 Tax=Pacificimonas pallii TaxID=2827236 RepID=A0ABS6SEY6_9SPHN|nr:protein-disulfide reductase DsbD domain-containing protein [Pacificimonas pallii]MBV7256978.1 thioredoxin family protein [Pacificimonas pallii]